MSGITSGTGLISGIDTAGLINSILTLESTTKFRLQARVAQLQSEQAALLEVNSGLLAFKSAATNFRTQNVFQSVLASSSDPETIAASAANGASPGTYTFIAKQLVSSSQYMTKGYATSNETPMGLETLAFEFGQGRVTRNADLEELNGGNGAARGKIDIVDKSGASATIDLTDVVTIQDVVDRINENEDVAVTAAIGGQGLVITDESGGGGTLSITDTNGYSTATELGIDDAVASNNGSIATGASVFYLGLNTAIRDLNDENGVLIKGGTPDLYITDRAGNATYEIDFGRIDNDIDDDTLLEDLNDGEGVRIDGDSDTADIKFTDRNGNEYEIDLTGIETVGQLKSRISAQTGGVITLSVTDGDSFTVTDTVGGTGLLKIEGPDDGDSDVAEDLGIFEEDGVNADSFTGEEVPSTIDLPEATTIQDIIDRVELQTGGNVELAIRADGLGFRVIDNSGGGGNLTITSTPTNPDAASQLGLEIDVASSDYSSTDRIIGGLDSVLVKTINGGAGLGVATTINVTDREGDTASVLTLDSYDTISEMIDAINTEAAANNVDVTFALNESGNGIVATDNSVAPTGNLTISGDGADALGLTIDDDVDSVRGTSLQRQYVSSGTRVGQLNYGRGIGNGSFRITDSSGASADVQIDGSEKTVQAIIDEINSKGLLINARINDNGDGIIIEDTNTTDPPPLSLTIEALNGSTARDLNLIGVAENPGDDIDGAYERSIDVDPTDTLETVLSKIEDANIPVNASLVNTGSGNSPYRISFSSSISGARGDLVINTGNDDIGLNEISDGQDARIFFGSSDPSQAFLVRSSDNSFGDIVDGLNIDLLKASDDPVTITVARNDAAVVGAVTQFVTAFNDAIDNIDRFDFFDTETEERGLLFSNPNTAAARAGLLRMAQASPLNVDGQYQFLSQVGITINRDGHLELNDAKFREKFEDNPEAMEAFFSTYDIEIGSSEEIADGVTIERNETSYNALGIALRFERFLDDLTDSIDGRLTRADEAYESQLEIVNDRIAFIDARLESRRESLTREFAQLEQVIADLQTQSSSLGSIQTQLGGAF